MENPNKESIFKKPWVQSLTGIFLIILVVSGILLYKSLSSYVFIENSSIEAPVISIGTETPGILDEVYVKDGESVTAGEALARVDAEILKAKVDGVVIYVSNTPGQFFNSSTPIIKMIEPKELRVVGNIKETSGLSEIKVGDPVTFTVDAFGSKEYNGVVEEIAPTANDTSVVFSISDKREIKEYTVKARYDLAQDGYFKNGMSAKMKVYTNK